MGGGFSLRRRRQIDSSKEGFAMQNMQDMEMNQWNGAGADELERMDSHALLVELVRNQRKSARGQKIAAIVSAAMLLVMVLTLAILVPRVVVTLRQVSETVDQTKTLQRLNALFRARAGVKLIFAFPANDRTAGRFTGSSLGVNRSKARNRGSADLTSTTWISNI